MVVARGGSELVVIAVEDKAEEPFGNQTTGEWLSSAASQSNRQKRLAYLLSTVPLLHLRTLSGHVGMLQRESAAT